ncbi:uncharacterized protein B0I36DRAFT_309175 [Microdochium trichocladiopsis]|uniref:F-box domain-containing protein n=1 Tax=Microdochium trichocladiopsis TaxID=1682393 RepID=A0A9P9BT91_9PEZI|nr:uncharacterized protein B0I36DRAFT_309175 [Microdochium trichocladiopsis]KAH7039731.1 hypothetical protein B0I36DRAFT_309175 [Microdochium trichocladiopsis]
MATSMPRGSCVLCGVPIDERLSRSWTPHFRAVYVRNTTRGPAEAQLSGVGLRDHGFDRAPLGRHAHFYDNNFEPDNLCVFRLQRGSRDEHGTAPTQYGVPFHLTCWDILERVAAGDRNDPDAGFRDINLTHLHQFFGCFPEQQGRINWGHNYGFIEYEDSGSNFVGFERVLADVARGFAGPHHDPGESYPIQAALRLPKASRPVLALPARRLRKTSISLTVTEAKETDQFDQLPTEIRDIILFQLSSPDVLTLKLASRAIAETELGETFWASRFDSGQQMGHVYEARDATVPLGNWRDAYFEMAELQTRRETLRNRARIWGIADALLNILQHMGSGSSTTLQGTECGVPLPNWMFELSTAGAAGAVVNLPHGPDALRDGEGYTNHYGRLHDFSYGACVEPSRVRYHKGISRDARVWVSFIELPDARYISGLRFENVSGTAQSWSIGYIHATNEELLPPVSEDESGSGGALCGFELAVGSRGVLGLRKLGSLESQKGQWVGRHEGVPRKLLLLKEGVEPYMLTCGFDAIKLLVVWASKPATSNNKPASSTTIRKSPYRSSKLREHSLWYPAVPPAHCDLFPLGPTRERAWLPMNASSFSQQGQIAGLGTGVRVGQPHEVILFGGEHGEKLTEVTGLTMTLRDGVLVEFGVSRRVRDDKDCDHTKDNGDGTINEELGGKHDGSVSHMFGEHLRTGVISIPAQAGTAEYGTLHEPFQYLSRTDAVPREFRGTAKVKTQTYEFAIDGKSGERIVGIDVVGAQREDGHDDHDGAIHGRGSTMIGGLRISTNFGRCFNVLGVSDDLSDSDDSLARSRNIRAKDSGAANDGSGVLVGVYGRRDNYGRFVSLGEINAPAHIAAKTPEGGRTFTPETRLSNRAAGVLISPGALAFAGNSAALDSDCSLGSDVDELENVLGGLAL